MLGGGQSFPGGPGAQEQYRVVGEQNRVFGLQAQRAFIIGPRSRGVALLEFMPASEKISRCRVVRGALFFQLGQSIGVHLAIVQNQRIDVVSDAQLGAGRGDIG